LGVWSFEGGQQQELRAVVDVVSVKDFVDFLSASVFFGVGDGRKSMAGFRISYQTVAEVFILVC
jgi:hypothetical protein